MTDQKFPIATVEVVLSLTLTHLWRYLLQWTYNTP